MRAKWPARHLFPFFAITTQRLGTKHGFSVRALVSVSARSNAINRDSYAFFRTHQT